MVHPARCLEGNHHIHTEIARHVYETYGIDGWWAQNVTVGYERARGMRAFHERPDGFSGNASKTFPVSVERLFSAFVEPDERDHWLEGIELSNRTGQPNKSARFDVLPEDGRLVVTFVAKGPDKSAVQLQQERLADAEDVARWKTIWKGQFARAGRPPWPGNLERNSAPDPKQTKSTLPSFPALIPGAPPRIAKE